MKRKNQIIKRICAVLCAVLLVVSYDNYFAATISLSGDEKCQVGHDAHIQHFNVCLLSEPSELILPTVDSVKYPYYMITERSGSLYCVFSSEPFTVSVYSHNLYDDAESTFFTQSVIETSATDYVQYYIPDAIKNSMTSWTSWKVYNSSWPMLSEFSGYFSNVSNSCNYRGDKFYFCNSDIVCRDCGKLIYSDGSVGVSERYNSALGYLQNVTRKSTYIRDALYNFDEDSLTYHWTHDLTSTTGVDLSSGNYKIRHYISMATVMGYEKDDIVEMSDKYLVGEYDASDGGFSYLEKDYDDKIAALGYENIGWFDSIFKGYFVLEHNYFQIVNSATNEVGGYLHFYPKDSDSDSFGVEYEYEGLDNDFVLDEDGPSGFIDNQTGSGLTHEDALENAEQPKLDDLGGVNELTANLDAYASQIGGVTNGIGALFGQLPPWIVGLLGLSVALSFALVVFKVLRG